MGDGFEPLVMYAAFHRTSNDQHYVDTNVITYSDASSQLAMFSFSETETKRHFLLHNGRLSKTPPTPILGNKMLSCGSLRLQAVNVNSRMREGAMDLASTLV